MGILALGWLAELAAPAVALVIAFVGGLFLGKSRERVKQREEAERAYRETRERMDDAELGNDPAAARDWLRERQRDRDL